MTKAVRAKDICALLQGELEGDGEAQVYKPAKIEEGEQGAISFFANPKYERFLYTCASTVLLLPMNFAPKEPLKALAVIRVPDVYASLSRLMEHFDKQLKERTAASSSDKTGETDAAAYISPQAFVDASATIEAGCRVEAFAFVGANVHLHAGVHVHAQAWIECDVEIGENTLLYSGVKIYKGTQVGKNCVLHANAVIGKDGFGFAPQGDGTYKKIPQLGTVDIGDDVEIGANTVIDRAVMGRTQIGNGVKIDNLVQIAHNVSIGENTVIAAQAGIAGSTKIGKNCMIGGQAGFVGHIEIADGTKIQAQSGVDKSIKQPNTAVYGSPALPYADYLRSYVVFKNLPALQKRLQSIEQHIHNPDITLID